jgi:hypothetical protein
MINLTREEAQQVLDALESNLDCHEDCGCTGRLAGKLLRVKLSEPEPEQMTSSSIARARAVAGLLRERNIQTWDDTDREAVFAIDALVSFASMLLNKEKNT